MRNLLLYRLDHLTGPKKFDGESVRFDDELRNHVVATNLRKVPTQLLLALHLGLVLLGAFSHLLGMREVSMKCAEVGASYPQRPRSLQGGLKHPALLDILPFARGQVERLWLRERRERSAFE